MTRAQLFVNIRRKKSFLCIGLDTDINQLPKGIKRTPEGVLAFNKKIIDATHSLCVAYKPNVAFYESLGSKGWQVLEQTVLYIKDNFPDIFTIADAKRGDIGNTANLYARAFFDQMNFDSLTVAPYMGEDSVRAFLGFKNKWVVLLALTSNKGADDFQLQELKNKEKLFQNVLRVSQRWGTKDNMMFVVGATRPKLIAEIRKLVPEHFLLVPGIGAQGGSLKEVAKFGMNKHCGLLVNVSRSIIYAGNSDTFAKRANEEAAKLQMEMEGILIKENIF